MGRRPRVQPLVGVPTPLIVLAAAVAVALLAATAAVAGHIAATGAARSAGRSHPTPRLEPPWANRHPKAVPVPIAALRAIAVPEELRAASLHIDRIRAITASYCIDGPQRPLIVNVDQRSRVVLADGHHRLHAGPRAGHDRLPVEFRAVDHIKGHSFPVLTLLHAMATL